MTRSLLLVPLLLLAGCSASDSPPPDTGDLPTGAEAVSLDPAEFTAGSDNRWFPLRPGTRWTYREVAVGEAPLRVTVTVTGRTTVLADGIEARVVRDTVTEHGEVVEDTFDWYAQDADGNVWYLGEDTAEFEDGRVTTRAGSFEAGSDGALPGIVMPADPRVGDSYRQEYDAGNAEDNGAVLARHQQVATPEGPVGDALLTADTNALEPRALEYKLYAPGQGLVLTVDVSGGTAREELVSAETVPDRVARAAGTVPLGDPYP